MSNKKAVKKKAVKKAAKKVSEKEKFVETDLTFTVRLYEDAMFLRTGIGTAKGTLPDGRTFEVDISANAASGTPLLGVKIKGSKMLTTYALPWDNFIQAVIQDAEKRYPKQKAKA